MKLSLCAATLFLGVALLAGGCKREPADDAAATSTADVMDQVAKAPEFVPPSDGRLTDAQMETYLDVLRREREIRQGAGEAADGAAAGLRAALELGHNPKEYQWVKERVAEAETIQEQQVLNGQVTRTQESLLAVLDKEAKETSNDEDLQRLHQQIRELREYAGRRPDGLTPDKAANAELVGRYQAELEALKAGDGDGGS